METTVTALNQPVAVAEPQPQTIIKYKDSVVVTDIQMPFMSMVSFMVKLALAAIPAAIILGVIWFFGLAILMALFGNAPIK
jgi:hypothetical protein